MPCGCRGGAKSGPLPQARTASVTPGRTAKRVAVYEVVVSGAVQLTTGSPTQARSEARRLGGSVRVSSRPVEAPALT
jgi:hypothetical protein